MAGTEGFTAALTHAYCFTLSDPKSKRRLVENYLHLSSRIPLFQVRFRPGLKNLDELLAGIESEVLASREVISGPITGDGLAASRE